MSQIQTPPLYYPTGQSGVAPRRETQPANFPRNSGVRLRGASEFCDAAHWDGLGRRHLGRYNLPDWSAPCDPEAMHRWLDRLDLTERDYERITATGLADFIAMNPNWPLRAFIGLTLEMREGAEVVNE